jgi:hypothetical protein
MSDGTGGRFPSDGDEADEGLRRGRGQEPDPETEGIEIVDDGADWLASQLAALPPDTTELPIVAAPDDETDGDADEDPVDTERDPSVDSGPDGEATTSTLLTPTVSDPAPSAVPAATVEPPLTRPRSTAPTAEPVSERNRRDEDAPLPPTEEPSPVDRASSWPGFGVEPDHPAAAAEFVGDDGGDDGSDEGDPEESDADLAPRSARPAHPNAIVIPGLPPRPPLPTPAAPAESLGARRSDASADDRIEGSEEAGSPETESPELQTPEIESPEVESPDTSAPAERMDEPTLIAEPTRTEQPARFEEPARTEASERIDDHDADGAATTTAQAAPSAPEDGGPSVPDRSPRPVGTVSTDAAETGDIAFGAFTWSLVANDEPDPRLERERLAAEAARRSAADDAERAEAERVAALPAVTTSAEADPREAPESVDTDGTGWLATTAVPGLPPKPPLPNAPATAPDPATGPDDAFPATIAMDTTPDGRTSGSGSSDVTTPASETAVRDGAPGASGPMPPAAVGSGSDAADRPTWSRPDLDDRFPATSAMDALPADEDPDDPDDEVEGADRASLGTTGLPVSAARAAAGSVEHVPVSSAGTAGTAGGASTIFPDGAVSDVDEGRPRRATVSRGGPSDASDRTRLLGLVGAGVVIVLALVALFYLGTRLPLILGGSPTAEASATPTPTPTPTPTAEAPATGPLAAGTYAWDELRGGECLEPYESPWAEEFTVVDCAEPHAAQLVFTAPYTDDPALPFPGEDVIASEIGLLCSAPGVVDFGAAAPFTDLQVQGAYPVSGEQWAAGDRDYFCFASRSSGEPLTASVATAP